MALTSIFTGMENGPEEIDKNFKVLDKAHAEISTTIPVLVDGIISQSKLYIERKGNVVSIHGNLDVIAVKRAALFKIPDGYTPISNSAVGGAWPSNTYSGQVCYFYYNASGLQMMPGPGFSLPSNNGINTVTGFFTYFTNDDFPTE